MNIPSLLVLALLIRGVAARAHIDATRSAVVASFSLSNPQPNLNEALVA